MKQENKEEAKVAMDALMGTIKKVDERRIIVAQPRIKIFEILQQASLLV